MEGTASVDACSGVGASSVVSEAAGVCDKKYSIMITCSYLIQTTLSQATALGALKHGHLREVVAYGKNQQIKHKTEPVN